MIDSRFDSAYRAPRRSFFGRVISAAALGFVALPADARETVTGSDGPIWPGKLKARHRQVVDAYAVNKGSPLGFVATFLTTNASPGAATAVIVLRHEAFPLALNNLMWEKYKIGDSMKIIDPETKAPAVKNPFLRPKPGVLPEDEMAIDWLLKAGALFGGCNVALQAQSKRLAAHAGVSADEAAQEWAANVVPGITIIPSGTWGVNRAQEAGCTYCSGGG
jgi:hypothetical protein